jgi:hypothetical protein
VCIIYKRVISKGDKKAENGRGRMYLVDRGGLRHEEEAFVGVALVQDINGLESHLLQSWLVRRSRRASIRCGLGDQSVVLVDVSVQPLGHVGDGENAQSALGNGSILESSIVLDEVVASVLELLVVVFALERLAAGNELFGTATEKNIRTCPIHPGIV